MIRAISHFVAYVITGWVGCRLITEKKHTFVPGTNIVNHAEGLSDFAGFVMLAIAIPGVAYWTRKIVLLREGRSCRNLPVCRPLITHDPIGWRGNVIDLIYPTGRRANLMRIAFHQVVNVAVGWFGYLIATHKVRFASSATGYSNPGEATSEVVGIMMMVMSACGIVFWTRQAMRCVFGGAGGDNGHRDE